MKPMRTNTIHKIMKLHSINCKVKIDDKGTAWGKIMVEDLYTQDGKLFSNWLNATSWNEKQVKDFLNY